MIKYQKLLSVHLLIFFCMGNIVAQSSTNIVDTVQYLQAQIIGKKELYVNKELNVLLNDLKIPCRSYWLSPSNKRSIFPGVCLFFIPNKEVDRLVRLYRKTTPHKKITNLIITWSEPVPSNSASKLLINSKGEWLQAEKEYYGKQVVKDIILDSESSK